jgi:hypothetical protein
VRLLLLLLLLLLCVALLDRWPATSGLYLSQMFKVER